MTSPCANTENKRATNAERAGRVLAALGVDKRLYDHANTAAFSSVPGLAGIQPSVLQDLFERWDKAPSFTVRLFKAKALSYFSDNSIQQALGAAQRTLAANEAVKARIRESVVPVTAYSGEVSSPFTAAKHSAIDTVLGTVLNGSTAFLAVRRGSELEVTISEGEFSLSFRYPFKSWDHADLRTAVAKALNESRVYDHDKSLKGKLASSEEELLSKLVRLFSDKPRVAALRRELEKISRPADLDCLDLTSLVR